MNDKERVKTNNGKDEYFEKNAQFKRQQLKTFFKRNSKEETVEQVEFNQIQ